MSLKYEDQLGEFDRAMAARHVQLHLGTSSSSLLLSSLELSDTKVYEL